MLNFNSYKELKLFMDNEPIQQLDIKFCDLKGVWRHITLMRDVLDKGFFEKGIGFDSSSVPRFYNVRRGDMAVRPDLNACFIDPVWNTTTLSVIGDIAEAGTGSEVGLDPRTVLKRAISCMKESGIADNFMCAPELEFYLFRNIQTINSQYEAGYAIDASGFSECGCECGSHSGNIPTAGSGYLITSPGDVWCNIRQEISSKIAEAGIPVRYHHVEAGRAGQQEIELGFMPALEAADAIMLGKYLVRSIASANGIHACFLPKPIPNAPGNGLHVHFRLFKNENNLLYGKSKDGLSETGRFFIGGILYHARAILAFACPTTNSYRRLRPGHETPVRFFYSKANREAAIRIPMYSAGEKIRAEFRPGDATMNPYLALAALLLAGLDGVKNKIDPSTHNLGPFDDTLPELDRNKFPGCFLPRTLEEALDSLQSDSEFLLQTKAFEPELLQNYISYKQEDEIDAVLGTPHPMEFDLYWEI